MRLTILGTEYQFVNKPTWTESLELGGSSASIELLLGTAIPTRGLIALLDSQGRKLYGGYMSALPVQVEGTKRRYQISGTGLDVLLTNLKTVKGYSETLSLEDHLLNLFREAGATDPDWPQNLLAYSIPALELEPFAFAADGEFLQQCLERLCQQIGCFAYGDWGTWTNSGHPGSEHSTIHILPNTFEGFNAPHDIIIPANSDYCGDMAGITGISYTAHAENISTVVVAGKNADLTYVDAEIPVREETVSFRLEEGDTERHFPLLAGATSIISVQVDMTYQTLAYLRADDPTNFTDEDGAPVDCLVDLTGTEPPPVLIFENAPAAASFVTITIVYGFEYAIGKATVEGRAMEFGQSLGVDFEVEVERLIRRDDIDLPETAQQVADNERDLLILPQFEGKFSTYNQLWRAGQGFRFFDDLTNLGAQVVSRNVGSSLESSDGTTDRIKKDVSASRRPVITAQQTLIDTRRKLNLRNGIKLRI